MENMEKIEMILKRHQLGSLIEFKPANEFASIGSDGIFLVKTTKGSFTLKFINSPLKLKERLAYHQAVAPFLPAPKIIGQGQNYALFDFIEGASLLAETIQKQEQALPYYQEALEKLSWFWQKTKRMNNHPKQNTEYQRAEKLTLAFLGEQAKSEIVVNGKRTGFSFNQVFSGLVGWLKTVKMSFLAHGDTRTDNIIVCSNSSQSPTVAFIDMRPGFSWLDDLALLGWQENFRFVQFKEGPFVQAVGSVLLIDFELKSSGLGEAVGALAWQTGQRFAKTANQSNDWQSKYYYTLALAAICELAGVQLRRKLSALDRELPLEVEYFWLARAVQNYQKALSI